VFGKFAVRMKTLRLGCFLFFGPLTFLLAKDETPAAKAAANALADGPAMVREWKPPVYPADALKEKVGGRITTRIIVDENGAVTSARVLQTNDPRLGEAALASVKAWKFSPAIENQKPVPMCLDVPFNFDAQKGAKSWKAGLLPDSAWLPRPAPKVAAAARSAPPGGYPEILSDRKLSGKAIFTCTIQPDGQPTDVRILAATHADFVVPALNALQKWEFSPAQQGDLTTAAELSGSVSFDSVGTTRADVLAANGITAPDGTPPANQPMPQVVSDPVWPRELLLKGEGGSATVSFTVEGSGTVTNVKVVEATRPEFGQALVAAMEQWSFDPAMADGKTVAVPLIKRAEFKAVPLAENETSSDPVTRLARLERAGLIRGGAGLDGKLTPIYRIAPIYPAALHDARPSGQAVIEFIVDRDGRARLPLIVSATHEEFGWAAATSIAQWVFKIPTRDGKPTEVKVQIPVNFTPPAQ
jgi:TonB family protein